MAGLDDEDSGDNGDQADDRHKTQRFSEDHGAEHGEEEAMVVEEDGAFEYWATLGDATLEPGAENSLNDADGSAIVIHAGTDPSEDEANRAACGVIFAPIEAGADATPVATPED